MTKHIPVILALALAVFTFLPSPAPRQGGPVAAAMSNASRSDKAALSRIYTALADKTAEDNGTLITTLSMWRTLHSNTLKLAAAQMKGRYAGLDTAVEKVLADHVPLDDVALKGVVDKVVAGCREVAEQSE
jgi:hypothetical protein